MGRASLLLFDENYQHATEEIAADVSSFLNEVIGDTDNKRQESMIKMKKIMTIQSILFGVLIVQSLAMIAMILINNRIKQKENLTFINQIIHAFARSIDIKDKYTNGHSMRVAKYAKLIAKKAGFNSKEAEALYNIGLLHDIGKIIIPDHILNKSGRLTDDDDLYCYESENPASGKTPLRAGPRTVRRSAGAGIFDGIYEQHHLCWFDRSAAGHQQPRI